MTYRIRSKKQTLKMYEEYKDLSKSVASICDKYKIKQETLVKNFKKLGLEVRPAGFRAMNSRGRYGIDVTKLAYAHIYKFAYQRRALRKGLEFLITEDEFIDIVTKDCHHCGKKFGTETRTTGRQIIPMMTVDRLDSSIGYIKSNCVASCKQCNTIKMDIPLEEWYKKMALILHRKCLREMGMIGQKQIVKENGIKIFEGRFTSFVSNIEKGRHFRLENEESNETLDIYTIDLAPFHVHYYKIEMSNEGFPLHVPITVENMA